MTNSSRWYHPKRLGSLLVLEVLLLQTMAPAFAASTGYAGTISQLPGGYITPPDANVMFTLDDSLSMQSDVIPDILPNRVDGSAVDLSGLPPDTDDNSSAVAPAIRTTVDRFGRTIPGAARQFPDMWGHPNHTATAYLNAQYYSAAGGTAQNIAGRYLRSSDGNPLYYNPKVRYRPWPVAGDDTTFQANANPAAVNIHPTDPTVATRTINLNASITTNGLTFWPATYFIKTSTAPLAIADPASAATATFTRVEIRPDVATYAKRNAAGEEDKRTDCAAKTSCTYAEERQNFANWLQYYRSRALMAKGGVAAAFAKQANNLRVGFGTINNPVTLGVREFGYTSKTTGAAITNRSDFYTNVYAVPSSLNGTPLRTAMDTVGQYFQRSNVGNPWALDPTSNTVGTEYACRRSFHILSTDGFWNGNAAAAPANANNDDYTGQLTPPRPDGTTSKFEDTAASKFGVSPFADGVGNTLADVAAYYWKTDLRTNLTNNVITSPRDPAFWQHLNTFTVGLGVSGSGTATARYGTSTAFTTTVPTGLPTGHPLKAFEGKPWLSEAAIREQLVSEKTPMTWPTPTANAFTTGDDLVHAAMNGRGRYFTATDPTTLANNLASALAEAADNPGDVASVAADAPQVRAGGKVFQATFSPSRWYGRLYAFAQGTTGVVNNKPSDTSYTNPDQLWEASNKMPAPGSRNIYTSRGSNGTGRTFTWADLTSQQKTALGNDTNILDFLRGDGSKEVINGGAFRTRTRYPLGGVPGGVLGDIIGGSPVKGPDAGGGYERLPTSDGAQSSYASFRAGTGLDNMRNSIFLGSNDGMMHTFSLTDGVERFAYVPNAVFDVRTSTTGRENKLQLLATDLSGAHRFTVDGPPNVSDAFVNGAWKTVLTGSNGAGARGIYALDVTDPVVGSTGFGTGKVMWEFTDADNADMGHSPAYPHVARMPDGTWVAIFGNGYDSTNGQAKLFILKLSDGSVLREIAVGAAGNNGLSQPNLLLNSNREVIAIYAGDLKGNLWKFDTSANSASAWDVALGGTPLVTVIGPTGTLQPISVMPEITQHPSGGAVLTFGTGKLFETSDTATDTSNVNLNTQSIYGIWDKPSETAGLTLTTANRASQLQVQTAPVFSATDKFKGTSATGSTASQRGWAIDLGTGGERVNLAPQQVSKVVFVVANKPAPNDPCSTGGSAKTYVLDPVTGASPPFGVFDANADAKIDQGDVGLNIQISRAGMLTQPIFQLTGAAAAAVPSPTVVATTPLSFFDRGQATAARAGGVELLRSFGGSGPTGVDPCTLLMTAAMSDTSLMSNGVKVCDVGTTPPTTPTKPRISWRQLQ